MAAAFEERQLLLLFSVKMCYPFIDTAAHNINKQRFQCSNNSKTETATMTNAYVLSGYAANMKDTVRSSRYERLTCELVGHLFTLLNIA